MGAADGSLFALVFCLVIPLIDSSVTEKRSLPTILSAFCGAHTFTYLPDYTDTNPLRGFAPDVETTVSDNFAHSLKFSNVNLRGLMEDNAFDWERFDATLQNLNQNFQLIVSFVLDCRECLLPNEDDLKKRLTTFFKDFAEKYGDTRIAFIMIGGLDLPLSFGDSSLDDLEIAVLDALEEFNQLRVLVSSEYLGSPLAVALLQRRPHVGLFDPNFSNHTYSAHEQDRAAAVFYNTLMRTKLNKRWQHAPVIGMAAPGLRNKIFSDTWSGENLDIDIQRTHVSIIRHNTIFNSNSPRNQRLAHRTGLSLGYQIFIKRICLHKCPPLGSESGDDRSTSGGGRSARGGVSSQYCAIISVLLQNRGSAPFYYPLRLVVETPDGQRMSFSADLSRLLPAARTWTIRQRVTWARPSTDSEDSRKLSVSLSSPATHLPIMFANKGVGSAGQIKLLIPRRCFQGETDEDHLIQAINSS